MPRLPAVSFSYDRKPSWRRRRLFWNRADESELALMNTRYLVFKKLWLMSEPIRERVDKLDRQAGPRRDGSEGNALALS